MRDWLAVTTEAATGADITADGVIIRLDITDGTADGGGTEAVIIRGGLSCRQ